MSIYLYLGLAMIGAIFSFWAWLSLTFLAVIQMFFYFQHKKIEDRIEFAKFKFEMEVTYIILSCLDILMDKQIKKKTKRKKR